MYFVLDHDVDAEVAGVLRAAGHRCETAADWGLATADDDDLSVAADNRDAVVMTHDKAFIARRRRNTYGRHVHLRCPEPDAVDLVRGRLEDILGALAPPGACVVRVSRSKIIRFHPRWA